MRPPPVLAAPIPCRGASDGCVRNAGPQPRPTWRQQAVCAPALTSCGSFPRDQPDARTSCSRLQPAPYVIPLCHTPPSPLFGLIGYPARSDAKPGSLRPPRLSQLMLNPVTKSFLFVFSSHLSADTNL